MNTEVEVDAPVEKAGTPDQAKETFVIFVGNTQLKFHETPVKAGIILEDAAFTPPSDFVLEELQDKGGKVIAEYDATQDVPLEHGKEKFFRAVPRGGGRS